MHARVNRARGESTAKARLRSVDENKTAKNRSRVTSPELEMLLHVCAKEGDRRKAARAKALRLGQHPNGCVTCLPVSILMPMRKSSVLLFLLLLLHSIAQRSIRLDCLTESSDEKF